MKYLALAVLLLSSVAVRADSVFNDDHPFRHHELLVVADYLEVNSVFPISWDYAKQLSHNILVAQKAADMDQADSLPLSELCVLRALGLRQQWGSDMDVIVWAQSNTAIDDRASLTLTPGSIDFGDVIVGTTSGESKTIVTPEPSVFSLAAVGLLFVAIGAFLRKRFTCPPANT